MDANFFSFMSIIAFLLSIILFIFAVTMFIYFRIPSVINELTGKTARKQVNAIRKKSQKAADKRRMSHEIEDQLVSSNKTGAIGGNLEDETVPLSSGEEMGNSYQIQVNDSSDTSVLVDSDATELLTSSTIMDEEYGATVLLENDADCATVLLSMGENNTAFAIIESVVIVSMKEDVKAIL